MFSFSKVDLYKYRKAKETQDVIDLKFPSEISKGKRLEKLVFVVDDNPAYLKILTQDLSKSEIIAKSSDTSLTLKIKPFATGEECLKHLNHNPDVIILDYVLNDYITDAKDGFSIFKEIKEINPNQQVVMLSGQQNPDIIVESLNAGITDYIVKDNDAVQHLKDTLAEKL